MVNVFMCLCYVLKGKAKDIVYVGAEIVAVVFYITVATAANVCVRYAS